MDRGKHTDERSTVTGVACWLAVQLFFLLMADGEAHECKTGGKERRMKARESGVREKDRRRKHRLSLNNAAGIERERERENGYSWWIVRLASVLLNDTGREFDGR